MGKVVADKSESVQVMTGDVSTSRGAAGLKDQIGGGSATVSTAANATGGIAAGNLVESYVDDQLFKFNSGQTPLMDLMLKSKKVRVDSPVVNHYMIDEQKSYVTTKDQLTGGKQQGTLPLESEDVNLPRPYTTLLVKGVNGFSADGKTETPGKELMLFVTGIDAASGNPIVRACNGKKSNPADEYCLLPDIPANSTCIVLANALYETQKHVDPDMIVPEPSEVYLQKRGLNQIVSDYFDSQRKRIPFSKAVIAEQAIANFKAKGNRTLWAGRKGRLKVNVPNMGMQDVYFTEGIRWQFKREYMHVGKWTIEKLIALAKMFFTGNDVPKTATLLAGKNLLEQLQCIDYSKHPEIQIVQKDNKVGWSVTNIHTVFGDIEVKREPTLDFLGWSNSGALIGEDRLVHYEYSSEHSFKDRIDGEEAERSGLLVWDALALKGACHIWIDGEGDEKGQEGSVSIFTIEDGQAPSAPIKDAVYYVLSECELTGTKAKVGQMFKYDGAKYVPYQGEISVGE